jgi:hypothetical protein
MYVLASPLLSHTYFPMQGLGSESDALEGRESSLINFQWSADVRLLHCMWIESEHFTRHTGTGILTNIYHIGHNLAL